MTGMKQQEKSIEVMAIQLSPPFSIDRDKMSQLTKKRFYCHMSHGIYGGTAGLYDFGPLGTSILENLLDVWHKHFVMREQMMKISCPILTPDAILKASGHVDKFADYMVKDTITGECFRLDHIIKENLKTKLGQKNLSDDLKEKLSATCASIDELGLSELKSLLAEHNIRAPVTGNPLSEPEESNLMFSVTGGRSKEYLRPETAQNIFLNFKKLYEFNQHVMPFAVAQIGQVFRNEINPRPGLLRGREFTMAEVEHFCLEDDKKHHRFSEMAHVELVLYSADDQKEGNRMRVFRIGDAVQQGIVANETLGYYMGRIYQYLVRIGIHEDKIRFRQHLSKEMAHYASDCWDAECYTSYGWVECVGCADRSAHDLQCHSESTGTDLTVERTLDSPIEVSRFYPKVNKKELRKLFNKRKAKEIEDIIKDSTSDELEKMKYELESNGEYLIPNTDIKLTKFLVPEVTEKKELSHTQTVLPSVIEPSFGIGRIFYTLLEHNFKVREEDEKRTYFSLRPSISPIKVLVVPLSLKHLDEAAPFIRQIVSSLEDLEVSYRLDHTKGSMGRRYARSDEMAIPYAVTVDFDTMNTSPASVTLRERDSTAQVRIPVDSVSSVVHELATERIAWTEVVSCFPAFTEQTSTTPER